MEEVKRKTSTLLLANGYREFEQDGGYLYARINVGQPLSKGHHVGDMRIKFTYVPCGSVTVVAA